MPHEDRTDDVWEKYERMKREFVRNNPTATQSEYEEFIRRIVNKLGI